MRKLFVACVCTAALVCGASLNTMSAATPSLELVGKVWMDSTQNEKLAFLYGVSSVVAIEQIAALKEGKEPSLFVRHWMQAFKNIDWKAIQTQLDDWYTKHPGESGRSVFDVLWYEFMAPKTGK